MHGSPLCTRAGGFVQPEFGGSPIKQDHKPKNFFGLPHFGSAEPASAPAQSADRNHRRLFLSDSGIKSCFPGCGCALVSALPASADSLAKGAILQYQREILYRPRCRNADRAWRIARFALIVSVLTVILVRYGFLAFTTAYPAFVAGLVLAAIAILFALAAFIRIWRKDDRGIGAALIGFFCASVVLLAPSALQAYLFLNPGSNDITTDYQVPPPFSRSAGAFAARDGMIPGGLSQAAIARHISANFDITSLVIDTDPEQLFLQVQEIARDNGWSVIATVAPGGRFGDGHVDIVLWTPLLRLPVDMTIRITPVAGGNSKVDMRCVSRYLNADYADNATIVRDFLAELAQGAPLG